MDNYTGLIIACPVEVEYSKCPFKGFRAMPLEKAYYKWKIMNSFKKEELIKQHLNCMAQNNYA